MIKRCIAQCLLFVVTSVSIVCAVEVLPITTESWRFIDRSGSEVALDGVLPLAITSTPPRTEFDGISLLCDFSLPSEWKGPLGICLYKNNMSIKVFVNDVYIDTLGRPGPDFFFQPYITRGVLVPQSILASKNTLRMELWNDTGTYQLRMMNFWDEATYRTAMNRFNFLDVQLPRFACMLLLFVSVYSLFLFINYRGRKESICLSMGSFFFAMYLLNVSAFDAPISYITLKALFYACFPLSIVFVFRFFRQFFGIRTGRKTMMAISAVGFLFACGYFFMGTTVALDSWHSLMLLYPIAAIVYGFYGSLRCLLKGRLETLSTILGLVVAVAFSAYDIYFFLGNHTPMILLQGIGFMSMILGNFYSFSQEIADTNRKCALYADEMERNKVQRDRLFQKIREDTIKSEESTHTLGLSIQQVGTLMTQYLASIDNINSSIETQSDQVSQNKDHVERIFSSIQETSQMVEQHEKLVEITVSTVRELTEGIHRTDTLVKASGETLQKLTSVCLAADRDVAESLKFVEDLADYSENITEIVKSISDLAEQTNILSINAAIEAARSGQMGKGFAVVASEIRSLATRSGESADQIRTILGTMLDKIRVIQRQETLVSSRLKDIVGENELIDRSITEIFTVLENQLSRNERIGQTIQELVQAVHRIAEQATDQKNSGENLKDSLVLLEAITSSILTASREQRSCNEELKDNLEQLTDVSRKNQDVVHDLKELIV